MVFRRKWNSWAKVRKWGEKKRRYVSELSMKPVIEKPRHHLRMSGYQKLTLMMMQCIDLTWVTLCQHWPKHYVNSPLNPSPLRGEESLKFKFWLITWLKVVKCAKHLCGMDKIDLVQTSRNSSVQYPTKLLSEQKFAYFWSERSTVGYTRGAFWDLRLCGTTWKERCISGENILIWHYELTVAAILDLSKWGIFCKPQLVFPSSILRLYCLLYTGNWHWKYSFGLVMFSKNWITFALVANLPLTWSDRYKPPQKLISHPGYSHKWSPDRFVVQLVKKLVFRIWRWRPSWMYENEAFPQQPEDLPLLKSFLLIQSIIMAC